MSQICLVITSRDDPHADYLISKINEHGLAQNVVRLNTEDFAVNCKVSFDGHTARIHILDSDKVIISDCIYSVWYRRPKKVEYVVGDAGVRSFIQKQSDSFLKGFYFLTHEFAKWVNPLPNLEKSRIKMYQIFLARKFGLKIPRTIITNNPNEAYEFSLSTRVINKSLNLPFYYINNEFKPFFTVETLPQEIKNSHSAIEMCPTFFQEFVDKKYDVRVIYVDKKLFSFAIYSQENQHSKTDFRGVSPHLLKHEIINLSQELEDKIRNFIHFQGLLFSALDFVVDHNDNFYFLENNPNGQWVWLEYCTNTTLISQEMISLLVNKKT